MITVVPRIVQTSIPDPIHALLKCPCGRTIEHYEIERIRFQSHHRIVPTANVTVEAIEPGKRKFRISCPAKECGFELVLLDRLLYGAMADALIRGRRNIDLGMLPDSDRCRALASAMSMRSHHYAEFQESAEQSAAFNINSHLPSH